MNESRLNYLTIMDCGIFDKLHTILFCKVKLKGVAFEFAHFHDLFLSLFGVHILYLFDLFLSFGPLIILLGLHPLYIFYF